ncbi:glycosyltransferase family 2 protein [Candidatus Nitrospira inopinata]|nr:glycosyltransferase family 2 protein [Candidatus Nitrospira inopinata]
MDTIVCSNGHSGRSPAVSRIAALMACHNRVAYTTQSVRSLNAQSVAGASVDLFLVDDGSHDGTAQAVRTIMPHATILTGDGSLFWCGAVRWAFAEAIRKDYDFYLWLNDDTMLDHDALARMLETHRAVSADGCEANIIVGSTRDPYTGLFTYGGWSRYQKATGLISWKKTPPHPEKPLACDTMNGNCVLISKSVVERIGNLDAAFVHSMGDLDYGLRATKNGCRVYIAPGYYGTCLGNTQSAFGEDGRAPLSVRWKQLIGPKGFPVRAWGIFTYRHKGPLWFLAWLWPYLLFWFKAISSPQKDW